MMVGILLSLTGGVVAGVVVTMAGIAWWVQRPPRLDAHEWGEREWAAHHREARLRRD